MFDVIIIGGSYAGLSAALQLARARKNVLVLDAGQRRNRFASSSHGFLGSDGASPESIAARGRQEVLAYPTVTWHTASAARAERAGDGFAVNAGSAEHAARRLILATGVVDELPAIPGVADLWGTHIFHCPYCHGYELDRGPLGLLATHEHALQHVMLVAEWSAPGQTTLFLDNGVEPDARQRSELAARGIVIEQRRVVGVSPAGPTQLVVKLDDGASASLAGLFVLPRTRVPEIFAEQLGCELETGPTGGTYYKTDSTKQTTTAGVFACGDAALPVASVAIAVADGAIAGIAAHKSLVYGGRG